ncbi:MerR family transcriptional regulator [Crossiella sp. CA-258035]|uniref:MerR family transcriptional regulator n=1 Tax=Crossiella sp. CA-258035 TaxID=2981138 RepID=UPI0024BC5837|nr:MerR family transcriptional regulator [Crossiella sp. CA-258035]WHT18637.1 MerR family transcriptional regulator [Crossiella sp. CA-258035]
MHTLVPIGEAAARLGLATSALRYYERRGLLTPALRRGNTRCYDEDGLRRLAFIQAGQQLGLSLEDLGALLAADRAEWQRIIEAHVAELEARIARAQRARVLLRHPLNCVAEHPATECEHLRGLLDEWLQATP